MKVRKVLGDSDKISKKPKASKNEEKTGQRQNQSSKRISTGLL